MNELSFIKIFEERKERKKQNKKKTISFYFVKYLKNRFFKILKVGKINNDFLLQQIEQRNYAEYNEYFFLSLLDGLNRNQVQRQGVVQ